MTLKLLLEEMPDVKIRDQLTKFTTSVWKQCKNLALSYEYQVTWYTVLVSVKNNAQISWF